MKKYRLGCYRLEEVQNTLFFDPKHWISYRKLHLRGREAPQIPKYKIIQQGKSVPYNMSPIRVAVVVEM